MVITVAIIYCFKKTPTNMGQILRQRLMLCSRPSRCCIKRARAEPLYDVPDYYKVPPLPPRNEIPIPTIEHDATCKPQMISGDQDESSQHHFDPREANKIVNCTSLEVQMQENSSYHPSTTFSDFAPNPAYGTNIVIAPEILTEQNEAYMYQYKLMNSQAYEP